MVNNSKCGVVFRPKWYRAILQSWVSTDVDFCVRTGTITLHKNEEHCRLFVDKILDENRVFVQQTKTIPLTYDHPEAPAQEARVPYTIMVMLQRMNGDIKLDEKEYVTLVIVSNVRYIVDINTFKKHENIFRKEYDFLTARR